MWCGFNDTTIRNERGINDNPIILELDSESEDDFINFFLDVKQIYSNMFQFCDIYQKDKFDLLSSSILSLSIDNEKQYSMFTKLELVNSNKSFYEKLLFAYCSIEYCVRRCKNINRFESTIDLYTMKSYMTVYEWLLNGISKPQYMKINSFEIFRDCYNLTILNFSHTLITTLKGLEQCVNLLKLCCEDGLLITLEGIQNCEKLQELNVNNNQLTNLNHINSPNLKNLYCLQNRLITLHGLENCKKIQKLNVNDNYLENLKGLENCISLTYLYVNKNKLKSLEGIEHCIKLKSIYIDTEYSSIYDDHIVKNIISYFNSIFYTSQLINVANMINGEDYIISNTLLKFDLTYLKMNIENMNKYHSCLEPHVDMLMNYRQDDFLKTRYFDDHKKEIVEKYNLTKYYDDIYLIKQYTNKECSICTDTNFRRYVRCKHGHIFCFDCFKLCSNQQICCICTDTFDVKEMYYIK
jgi:hypothetical protein